MKCVMQGLIWILLLVALDHGPAAVADQLENAASLGSPPESCSPHSLLKRLVKIENLGGRFWRNGGRDLQPGNF